MSMTTATRWSIATLVFLAIGWADVVHGHRWGLALLVGALLVVYFFGGHGPRPRPGSDDGAPSDPAGLPADGGEPIDSLDSDRLDAGPPGAAASSSDLRDSDPIDPGVTAEPPRR